MKGLLLPVKWAGAIVAIVAGVVGLLFMVLDDRYAAKAEVEPAIAAIETQLVDNVDYWWNEVWPEYTSAEHERLRPIIEAIVAKYATEREDALREEFRKDSDRLEREINQLRTETR